MTDDNDEDTTEDGSEDEETKAEEFERVWNGHIDDFGRLKNSLPEERHDEVDELQETARELVSDAREAYFEDDADA